MFKEKPFDGRFYDLSKVERFDRIEKAQKKRRSFLLVSKRLKRKKPESDINTLAKELTKKGVESLDGIRKYFSEKGVNIPSSTSRIYELIVKSKVVNNKLFINDTLANKPLHYYMVFRNLSSNMFSNDNLFLELLYHRLITDFKENKDQNTSKMLKCARLNKFHLSSVPFNIMASIDRGYYQDFSDKFAAVGLNFLPDKDQKELLSFNANTFEFTQDEVTYIGCGNTKACVVTEKKRMKEASKDFEKVKILKSGSRVGLDVKPVKSDGRVKFMDCDLKPDKFCPAFLHLDVDVTFNLLAVLDFDYNELFSYLETARFKSNVNDDNNDYIDFPDNILYWDTFSECMDFIAVFALTSSKISEAHKTGLLKAYDAYVMLKPVLVLWRKNQLFYQRILLEFYNSFNTMINYDKLVELHKKIQEYIADRDILILDETYNEVKAFFDAMKITCGMINRQLDESVLKLADAIKSTITELMSGNFVTNTMIQKIRTIGLSIYELSWMSGNKDSPAFPFAVSPGGFLGTVNKDFMGADPLALIIGNAQKEIIENKVKQENMDEETLNILSVLPAIRKALISNTITKIESDNWGKFSEQQRNTLMTDIDDQLQKNPEEVQKLNALCLQVYNNKTDPTRDPNIYFDSEFVNKIIYKFNDVLAAEQRKMEAEIANQKMQMANIQNNINNLNSNLNNPVVPNVNVNNPIIPNVNTNQGFEKKSNIIPDSTGMDTEITENIAK